MGAEPQDLQDIALASIEEDPPEAEGAADESESGEGEGAPTAEGDGTEGAAAEGEGTEGEGSSEDDAEPAADAREVSDSDVVEQDGKKVTFKAWREEMERGALRQADYTKKTQELAEERRENAAKYGKLEAEHGELRETLVSFAEAMASPREAYLELRQQFPDTFAAIIEHERSVWEAQAKMQPEERYKSQIERDKAIQAAIDDRRGKADKARQDQQGQVDASKKLQGQFIEWGTDVIKAAGEDPDDNALHRALWANASRRGPHERLTREDFEEALKDVLEFGKTRAAKDLSKLEAAQIEAALGEKRMQELGLRRAEKARARRPEGKGPTITGGGKGERGNGSSSKPRTPAGDFFDGLRDNYDM